MMRKLSVSLGALGLWILMSSWGFFAHKRINRLAVFTLPVEMARFYKKNILFLTEHAVDADKRRYADSLEAPRHFIDIDSYGLNPFDSIPQRWKPASEKFSEKKLLEHGIVPWQIERTYYSLVKAFKESDSVKILRYSADIGHYVSDAHVPLHTTRNYNGQLTGQQGIHGFWESRLPELFSGHYNFFVGKAEYLADPLRTAWDIVKISYSFKDTVLWVEKELSAKFRSDKKYSFSERNGIVSKQYSLAYSDAYHNALKGMVERQMRSSIHLTGSYWYSAWADAGQPVLINWNRKDSVDQDKGFLEKLEFLFKKGKILGRDEG